MSDPIIEPIADPVEPVVEPIAEPVEPIVDPVEPKEPEESGGSFISRIRAKFTGEHTDKEESGEEIPNEFTEAARQMNVSDEDTEHFAAGFQKNEKGEWVDVGADPFTNEQLLEMIPSLTGADAAKAEETAETAEKTSEAAEEKVEDSQDGEALKAALDRIAALEEKQGISETESKETEKANFDQRASDLFDEASKDFEVFGKTEDLPKFPDGRLIPTSPQMQARLEVYGMAQQLKEAGMSGADALKFSMNAYKGANLEVETQRNVIKGLKKREQTLGGKRVSHKATEAADLTGPETIAAVRREHGK